MNKKYTVILTLLCLTLLLPACSPSSSEPVKTSESMPVRDLEAAKQKYEELLAKEDAILQDNQQLWEKVFASADKASVVSEPEENYGDFLLKTIERGKANFTSDELERIKQEAQKIKELDAEVIDLKKQYPDLVETTDDAGMAVPADQSGLVIDADKDQGGKKFPAFEGKDFTGNAVSSKDLFSKNAVTVVNFWFTSCAPCIDELDELDAMNKDLAEKGGEVIGINSFTLDGDEKAIQEAQDVLAQKQVSYRQIYFPSDCDAGDYVRNLFTYPATCVVDRNGNMVGEPILGGITGEKQLENLQKLIDEALARDQK